MDLAELHLPRYEVPAGHDADSYLEQLVLEGLERRFPEAPSLGRHLDLDLYRERAFRELGVIRQLGHANYFLVVAEYVGWARSHGIPVGPGRGAVAGSLSAWALGITAVDPILHGLMFERFMNVAHPALLGIDVDVCLRRRPEVIRHIVDSYGRDRVAYFCITEQLDDRIRSAGRAAGVPATTINRIIELVPEEFYGKPLTIDDAMILEPQLEALCHRDSRTREMAEAVRHLEELSGAASIHPAGVIIGDRPLVEIAFCTPAEDGMLVAFLTKRQVDAIRPLKAVLLGFRPLTVLDEAMRLINARRATSGGPPLSLSALPTDDDEVLRMLAAGHTAGVYQLDAGGLRTLVKRMQPSSLEELIGLISLFRPGPLEAGMVDEFVSRGQHRDVCRHPAVERILRSTHGVLLYQEQATEILAGTANYTLAEAEVMRRQLQKAEGEALTRASNQFVTTARAHGMAEPAAAEVVDMLRRYLPHCWLRAHAVGYGLITWQMAYLKCHFPVEWAMARGAVD